ncbi:hypothetical protein [Cryptosporangium sp. NPDC051539]|uniref:hypothetical protein n=1 Tax=Cryptosporangium sp. NPDC051539 TaxID=3363962 RepID=UPI0037913FFA
MTSAAAPRSGVLDAERFAGLVELGVRAPSVHNSQPWRFRRRGDAVEILADAAAADACRLAVLRPRARAEVADLLRAADRELEQRPGYAAERRAWVRGLRSGADGIAWDLLAGRPHPDEPLLRRDFGEAPNAVPRRYESDPCVAVLVSNTAGRYDDLRAGQALQHVLLRATASG